jgi:hypothetical protein
MEPGIIILIVVLVLFVLLVVGLLILAFKGPTLPEGMKFESINENNKAIVIFDTEIPMIKSSKTNEIVSVISDGSIISIDDVVKSCSRAMTITEKAFKEIGVDKADIDEVVFVYKTDSRYDREAGMASYSAAYTSEITGLFGIKKKYVVTIRAKYAKSTVESGEPPIHEMIHVLNKQAGRGYDALHGDAKLWAALGQSTVQVIGDRQWVFNKKK